MRTFIKYIEAIESHSFDFLAKQFGIEIVLEAYNRGRVTISEDETVTFVQ